MASGLDGAGGQKIGEWVIQDPSAQAQYSGVVRSVESVSFYSSDIIGIPEFAPQLFEMGPIAVARRIAVGGAQVRAKFALKTIVVEQSVVDVEEKDDIIVHVRRPNLTNAGGSVRYDVALIAGRRHTGRHGVIPANPGIQRPRGPS